MCLIAIARGVSAKFPLVIAANRDELYSRPTRPAHVWEDDARVVGGRDLLASGSWLAARRGGRFAAVTNVRGVGREGGPSRGLLVADFVRGEESPMSYARSIDGSAYAGFHLIAGDGDVVHVSNSGVIGTIDGLFAISNAPPGAEWEKARIAREFVPQAIEQCDRDEELANALLRFLATQRGGPIEREIFVKTPLYGTRSSTVIVGDLFVEQNYSDAGMKRWQMRM